MFFFGIFRFRLRVGFRPESFEDELELVGMDFLGALTKEFRLEFFELPFEMLPQVTLFGVGTTFFLQIGLKSADLLLQIGSCRGSVDGLSLT